MNSTYALIFMFSLFLFFGIIYIYLATPLRFIISFPTIIVATLIVMIMAIISAYFIAKISKIDEEVKQ